MFFLLITLLKKKKGLSALNSDKKSTCRKCAEKNVEDFLQPAESKKNDSKKVSNEPKKPNPSKPENYEPVKVTQLNKLTNFSNDQAEAEKLSEEKAQTKTRMGFFFGQSSASDGARADGANINSTYFLSIFLSESKIEFIFNTTFNLVKMSRSLVKVILIVCSRVSKLRAPVQKSCCVLIPNVFVSY